MHLSWISQYMLDQNFQGILHSLKVSKLPTSWLDVKKTWTMTVLMIISKIFVRKWKRGSLWCRMSTKLHIERLGDLGNLRQRRKDLTLHREGQYQFNKCQSFSWPIPFRFGDKRTMSFHQITIWNSMSNKDAGYKTEDEVEWSWEVFSREDNTISTNDIFCSIFLELRIQCRHMKMQTGNSRKRPMTANTFILPTYPDIH